MTISVGDLYGKRIITSTGSILGEVKEVVLNMDSGEVSHLLLTRIENLAKSENMRETLLKNSILYRRVKSVSQTIIVSNK